MSFHSHQLAAWTALLCDEWRVAAKLLAEAGLPELRLPNFHIDARGGSRYGSWDAEHRLITIQESLLLRYPRGAVVEVLRHEIAHQCVSEAMRADRPGNAHGEEWKRACRILGCRDSATSCDEALAERNLPESSLVLNRVRKLLAHGRDETTTPAEAKTFLAKARALLLKHQLDPVDVEPGAPSERVWVQRPVGKLFRRLPGYYHTLGNLLQEHYLVHYIQVWYNPHDRRSRRTGVELFGEPDKVDVAEYVGHQLLTQGEMEWKRTRPRLRDPNKRSFMSGLFEGYAESLRADEPDLSRDQRALIRLDADRRDAAYRRAYRVREFRGTGVGSAASHSAGQERGRRLRIRSGLAGNKAPPIRRLGNRD